ncbi:MAG: hypothetical protein JXN64_04635 [Spirochaetes bacterium]|nr:hypothetical protein [Spirochaetota bacterium]
MSKDITNLIISVSNTMKEFADGSLSHNDAFNGYKKLLKKYNKIANKQKKTGNVNQIEGLCYYGNINNYSLLSGIYNIENDDIYYLAYYGDSDLNSRTMKVIANNTENISDNILLQIPPAGDGTFLHNIFLYPVFAEKSKKIIFASVSSSKFFSEDKFIFLAKLIKNIFSIMLNNTRENKNNYFESISDEVENYLKNNIDDGHSVQATLYVFNMLEKIFNHTGIGSLIEVSDGIFNTIKDNYRHNSKCITLSIRDYIALEKINNNDSLKPGKKKLEFIYKNINIPYHSIKLNISTKDSVRTLWDQILTFENYLSNGDIVK